MKHFPIRAAVLALSSGVTSVFSCEVPTTGLTEIFRGSFGPGISLTTTTHNNHYFCDISGAESEYGNWSSIPGTLTGMANNFFFNISDYIDTENLAMYAKIWRVSDSKFGTILKTQVLEKDPSLVDSSRVQFDYRADTSVYNTYLFEYYIKIPEANKYALANSSGKAPHITIFEARELGPSYAPSDFRTYLTLKYDKNNKKIYFYTRADQHTEDENGKFPYIKSADYSSSRFDEDDIWNKWMRIRIKYKHDETKGFLRASIVIENDEGNFKPEDGYTISQLTNTKTKLNSEIQSFQFIKNYPDADTIADSRYTLIFYAGPVKIYRNE